MDLSSFFQKKDINYEKRLEFLTEIRKENLFLLITMIILKNRNNYKKTNILEYIDTLTNPTTNGLRTFDSGIIEGRREVMKIYSSKNDTFRRLK